MPRRMCFDCKKIISEEHMLRGWNPFDKNIRILGCPHCKSIDRLMMVCEAPGCDKVAVCGQNSADGYVHVCEHHLDASMLPRPKPPNGEAYG